MHDYSHPRRTSKTYSKIPVFFIFFFCLFVITVFIFKNLTKNKKTEAAIPQIQNNQEQKITSQEELMKKINELIAGKTGSFSVYISDFNKNKSFGFNENIIFTAASVNKIPILASLYYLAENNELDLDTDITLKQDNIREGTGIIRYDPTGSVYSYKTLGRLMTEKSDNTAAYILGNLVIGLDKVQTLVDKWGLNQTDIELNKTSNSDQEKLLKLIYEGKIAGKALTAEMLDLLNGSDFEDRIPAFLPKTVPVYHKIGSEIRNIHDVGIVGLSNRPYYIGIFTSDYQNEEEAIKLIAEISRLTYNYFSQNPTN